MKIALIGAGDVATGQYLPFLAKQPDVELGIWNRDVSKAASAAAKFSITHFASLTEAAAWQPDTTLVLTSDTSHADVATTLLELGVKRMLVEKPLIAAKGQAHVTEEDFHRGKDLLILARKTGCDMAMMFNYRFFDQTLTAKRLAEERAFGLVINVAAQVHYACWSHCIDLIHHFAGPLTEITALSGTADRSGQGITAPDVIVSFRTESGATGNLLGTAGMKWQHPLFELIFTFENGRIHLRDIDGDLEILDGARRTHERISAVRDASRWDHYGASFGKALTAYLHSIREKLPPPVTGLDGLRELQVEAALKRSIAHRRPVLVQEEFVL